MSLPITRVMTLTWKAEHHPNYRGRDLSVSFAFDPNRVMDSQAFKLALTQELYDVDNYSVSFANYAAEDCPVNAYTITADDVKGLQLN